MLSSIVHIRYLQIQEKLDVLILNGEVDKYHLESQWHTILFKRLNSTCVRFFFQPKQMELTAQIACIIRTFQGCLTDDVVQVAIFDMI